MDSQDHFAHEDNRDTDTADRRAWRRADSTRPIPRRIYLVEDFQPLDAWIVDLSRGGLAVLLPRPVRVGALLFIELESLPEVPPVKVFASVARCEANPDGEWVVGCEFVARLSEEDLEAILR
jgi:hypothetical protein